MKPFGWFIVGAVVTILVVAVALGGGLLLVRGVQATPLFSGWGMMRGAAPVQECGSVTPRAGQAVQGSPFDSGATTCSVNGPVSPVTRSSTGDSARSLEDAQAAFRRYLDDLGYTHLVLDEVMEFDHNFYAIAVEPDTGMGAMELLLDKASGTVGPEIGPDMMWNTKYGMNGGGGMMGGSTRGDNTLTGEQALALAQQWLDENDPGAVTESHADAFYGYYTIHTLRDGQIDGMLSVHGQTGQIWYHTWHGDFVQMVELGGD